MARNVPPEQIYDFIVGDFEDCWNSLAADGLVPHRGNFMFARQAMTLLEWAARLCAGDPTGAALRDLSAALLAIGPLYFTALPGPCADFTEFALPSAPGPQPRAQLLWAMFDLVRNGHAHQYQQIVVDLMDGKDFTIAHSGCQHGFYLNTIDRSLSEHLTYNRDPDGNLYLLVRPDMLFLDLKMALGNSGVLRRGLTFQYLTRPRLSTPPKPTIKGPYYQFDSTALEASFQAGGHMRGRL